MKQNKGSNKKQNKTAVKNEWTCKYVPTEAESSIPVYQPKLNQVFQYIYICGAHIVTLAR